MTTIEIVDRDDVEAGAHVELGVGNDCRVFVTAVEETTSVVLADNEDGKQASIMVRDGEWTLKER